MNKMNLPSVALILTLFGGCASDQPTQDKPQTHASRNPTTDVSGDDKGYAVVNIMPTFWSFWDANKHKDLETQTAQFQEIVVEAFPNVFVMDVIGKGPKNTTLNERIQSFLQDMPARERGMRRLSEGVIKDLPRHDATFRAAFPEMKWAGTVYFTVSLDAFDGAVRRVDGEAVLLFGLDKIARLHGDAADLAPLFHHELFHLHHSMLIPQPDYTGPGPFGLAHPLWSEGLAVYVAQALNPGATRTQLVLTDAMVDETDKNLPHIASALETLLDDASEKDFADFFLGSGDGAGIPNRCGYYVGMRIAKRAGQTRTLAELARLQGAELRQTIDDALADFAKAPR